MEKEKVKMRERGEGGEREGRGRGERGEGGEWEGSGRGVGGEWEGSGRGVGGERRGERERESRGKESDFTANLIFSKRKSISSSTAKTPLRGHCEQQSLWEE